MKILGRHATEEEKENMLNPFFTNHGEEWTPDSIQSYIQAGADFISSDSDLQDAFNMGIAKLDCKEVGKA